MAIYSSNSGNNWTLSLKIVLISTGVLSMAVALKLSAPTVAEFVASDVPSLWSFAHSWLKPPYLYVVINCIIISIVASSKLQQKLDHHSPPAPDMEIPPLTGETVKISSEVSADDFVSNGVVLSGYGYGYDPNEVAKISVTENPLSEPVMVKEAKKESTAVMDGGDEAVAPTSAWIGLQRKDSLEYSFTNGSEKPPVSARFSHRKAAKASPEGGKALRVSKPKRQDTLENTWKTITEGRSMPLTRHLKKSDTWESHVRRNGPIDQTTPPPKMMKKSETYHDRSSANSRLRNSPGSGKLRKEPSLSQDELNRRVEAFINKFNEEMRLQRQESLNKYQEMIRRGAH